MNWRTFKEDPCWHAIVELFSDRLKLIEADLADIKTTATLLHVRVLQQELRDCLFILSLPDKLAKDLKSEGETENGELGTD